MNFFIYALPRSRTAWLANLFTTDRSVCFHEFSSTLMGGVVGLLGKAEHVGLSEPDPTAINYISEDILERSPILVVNHEAEKSYEGCLKTWDFYDTKEKQNGLKHLLLDWVDELEEIKNRPNCLSVDREDLKNIAVIERIWQHLLPLPFNRLRAQLLQELNITVRYKTLQEGFAMMERQALIAKE
jgi:hypothetical protein